MKKSLLLMAAIVGSSFAATAQVTETDVTPSGYKWAETNAVPAISSVAVKGSNPSVPAFTTWNGETEFNNGLIGIDGANNNNFNPDAIKAGFSIVDLGGEVGKVLALRGAACANVETDLAAAGVTVTIPQMSAATTWFDLNYFMDPNNTPTSASPGNAETLPTDAYIHVKLVMNIYTDDQNNDQEENSGAANITGMSFQSNQNSISPNGTVYEGIYAYNFFVPETEGEFAGMAAYDDEGNAKWDPTRWMVYEFDSYCVAADGTTSYAPMRVKMSLNGWANFSKCTLFIKELSFTKCSGTPEVSYYKAVGKSYETLTVGDGTTGISSATLTPASNGAKYSLDGKRVSDDYKGVVIENGSKSIVR